MEQKAFKISDSEAEIMKVIWSKDQPMTFSEIRAALEEKGGVKVQTIHSYVNRLVEKGVLKQEQRDVYYYSALVSQADYKKAKLKSLITRVFDGDAKDLMTALIQYDELSPADVEELRKRWREGGEMNG